MNKIGSKLPGTLKSRPTAFHEIIKVISHPETVLVDLYANRADLYRQRLRIKRQSWLIPEEENDGTV